MNVQKAKAVPLAEILQKYGHEPVQRRGTDIWYRSPFRTEETASFVVNTRKNVWYDHGEGKGGTVIDLIARLSNETSVARVLALVSEMVCGIVPDVHREIRIPEGRGGEKSRTIGEKELSHPALLQYLITRAIPPDFARRHVREIRYEIAGKAYFGIGFRNQGGGFEVRNPYFKGCVGTKDISVVGETTGGIVNVFEGFMDFLSWPLLAGTGEHTEAAIVLNSVSLADRAIARLREHPPEEIRLFLDNDPAGRAAVERIRTALPGTRVVGMADRYRDSTDVNQELVRRRDRKAELEKAMGKGP